MTQTTREIRLRARPRGVPSEDDFELVSVPLGEPAEGEVLVRNLWMSVDPYMRGRMSDRKSYVPPFRVGEALDGGAIGRVVASRASDVAVGDVVGHGLGWREHAIVRASSVAKIDETLGPIEAHLGALGMPGLTAYAGLFAIAGLRDGERVLVTAAAGAVGSVACQLARAHGCYVVGTAGSAEKCRWLEESGAVHEAIDYKTCGDLGAAIGEAMRDGIDVAFENVGGAHLEAAIQNMRRDGRIALCGMIEQYNADAPRPGPSNLVMLIGKRLTMRGFIVTDHAALRPAFHEEMRALIAAGRMKWRETIVEGLESAPRAFLSLFEGANTGKLLVRLADDDAAR
jgi:NADPH-dependent curcumin reductase CurA